MDEFLAVVKVKFVALFVKFNTVTLTIGAKLSVRVEVTFVVLLVDWFDF